MQKLLFLSLIVLALSACIPGQEGAMEIELTVLPIEITQAQSGSLLELTEEPETTPTRIPSRIPATLIPSATFTPTPADVRNTTDCTIQDDLPVYTVVSGDTLSNIATRYNTTTQQLSDDNCLSDSNLITVGMSLYVPAQPIATATPAPIFTLTPTPTITNLGVRGTLSVFPVIEAGNPSDWSDYVIEPGTSITVSWTGIEPEYYVDIVSVTFFFVPDVGASTQLGVDNDMSDGMSFTWTPRTGVSGSITGNARTNYNGFWGSSTLHIRDS